MCPASIQPSVKCAPFSGHHLHDPGRRQPAPAFALPVDALRAQAAVPKTRRVEAARWRAHAGDADATPRRPEPARRSDTSVLDPRIWLRASRILYERGGCARVNDTMPTAGG